MLESGEPERKGLLMALLESGLTRVALPPAFLADIVQSIVDAVPTEAIYVFGSYARGEARPESDVDLYVVTADGDRSQMADTIAAIGAISDKMFDASLEFDVISCPRRRFEAAKGEFGLVEHAVGREGVAIYDRAA